MLVLMLCLQGLGGGCCLGHWSAVFTPAELDIVFP